MSTKGGRPEAMHSHGLSTFRNIHLRCICIGRCKSTPGGIEITSITNNQSLLSALVMHCSILEAKARQGILESFVTIKQSVD
jgi:hypothetical protein